MPIIRTLGIDLSKNVWENTMLAHQAYCKSGISAQKLNFRGVPATSRNSKNLCDVRRLLRNVKRGRNQPRSFSVVDAWL